MESYGRVPSAVALHRRVRLVEHDLAARVLHRHRRLPPVGLRQQHDGRRRAPAGAPSAIGAIAATAAGSCQSSTLTTNSVPRTPSTEAGVRTFIASGDCFAILPETTASEPFDSVASIRALVRRRVERERVERQHAVRPDREQRVVAHRDADRAVGAGAHDVGGLDARAGLHGQRRAAAIDRDRPAGRLDLADGLRRAAGSAASGTQGRARGAGVMALV